ncbi:MAG: GAF domain-containing SpoIIE family protein phosphatase [Phycisphaeraceae bacterium]
MSLHETQDEAAALRRMLEVARQLSHPFDLHDLLTQIIDAGREILHADRGSVFLYDNKSKELYTVVAHGVQEIRFGIDKGIAGECARTREVVNVPDCYADPRFNQEIDRKTGYRTRCLITVPLVGVDNELVGVMQLLNSESGQFDLQDESMAELIASQAASAIQRVKLHANRVEMLKLERELDVARRIQMGVLPQTLPTCPGYDLASFSEPAEKTGGDIFDVVPLPPAYNLPSGLMMLLADATGHGVGPALSVTQVRAMLRIGVRLGAKLENLFQHINGQLSQDLSSDRFVTAFLGVLDPLKHEVAYVSGGQAPLLHYRAAESQCDWLDATTLPMGVMEDPPMDSVQPISMAPGDMLVLLTDGIYEYQNPAGTQFGKDRVGEAVCRHCGKSPQHVMNALLADLHDFAAGAEQMDDITGLIIKRSAQGA